MLFDVNVQACTKLAAGLSGDGSWPPDAKTPSFDQRKPDQKIHIGKQTKINN